MDNETLFYVCGSVLAVSAVLVTFVGLKSDKFPGRAMSAVVIWFSIFVVGAATFAVRYSVEHQEHQAHELEHANEEIEATEEQQFENEAGAQGGESEELEEEAEEGAEGSEEEEPVGPTEGSQEGPENGAESGAAGAATTLPLAADPTELAFDQTELTAKAGEVTIDFDNPSAIPHNVVIEEGGEELAGFEPITESEEELTADLKAGSYEFVCTVPGHEEAGMKGTLTVE